MRVSWASLVLRLLAHILSLGKARDGGGDGSAERLGGWAWKWLAGRGLNTRGSRRLGAPDGARRRDAPSGRVAPGPAEILVEGIATIRTREPC